ncbi:MAG TPA: thioredoxin domain-containing protein, partial [Chthonomonadaceae bacterium]|nr:thioredoxin domain-containing protein [Chthonomonadaceae bacterium]
MKSRQETILQIVLIAAFLLFLAYIVPNFLDKEAQARHLGDPTDVTALVLKETLLGHDRPERGAASARYTLVYFGDFECPTCAKAQPILDDLLRKRPDLKLIYRHFPHTMQHPHAMLGALAAEAARAQNKFWKLADLLYTMQEDWTQAENTEAALTALAEMAGLDADRFTADLHAGEGSPAAARIQEDMRAAESCSVELTPSFFLISPTHTWAAVGPVGLERLRDAKF